MYPTNTEEEREIFKAIAKRQWTTQVHGCINTPLLIHEYFERVKENIDPDEHVRFKATITVLQRGTKEEREFERKCYDFDSFETRVVV